VSDVFLSYARDDATIARRVAKALEAAGHEVWWDTHLPAHRAYSEEIERRLEQAKAVVVLWSTSAAQSQWVRAEADFARERGKLVQAQLDDGLPPMPFNQIQSASLKGWRGNVRHSGWEKLAASVAALVGGEARVPRAQPTAQWWSSPRARWLALAGALLITIAAFAVIRLAGGGETRRPVLAVLPFKSLDSRDASLVAGIWEDTRQAIGRNPQLLVLGPNTAEEIADKGSGEARKLADYLVEASIRSTGDRIRISANLVRTKDGSELWSKNFDRKLDDVFALQSEIAGEIEGHIRGRLAERGGTQPENIATSGEVYALYSDARMKIRKRQASAYDQAHEELEQVVRKDPNFAPGWATLAVVKVLGIDDRESTSSAEDDARRAIALAPNLAAGHAALGAVLRNGPAAQASLKRALTLDPNDIEALNWLANSLDGTQRDEKLRLYSRVTELEPLWWPAVLNKLNQLFDNGSSAAMDAELARVEKTGNERMTVATKIAIMSRRGDLSGAVNIGLDYYRRASENDRAFVAEFVWSPLIQLGLFDLADRISPPPSDLVPYIRKNDPHALDMIEARMSPKQFWTTGPLPIVGSRVYLLNNQGPRLARQYRAAASTPEQFEKIVGKDNFGLVAPGAALALRSVGDEAQAQGLLALAEAASNRTGTLTPEETVTLARILAVKGDTDKAVGLLSAAIHAGWLPPYVPIHTDIALDPPLNELRKDPRFERMRQQILGHLARERAELGPVRLG
jgi:TolB-like protein